VSALGVAGRSEAATGSTPAELHLFAFDPDLLGGLEPRLAADVRERVTAPRLRVDPGPWGYTPAPEAMADHFGLLVIDGLLVRTVALGQREASEVIGPGDVIRPWDACDVVWSVAWCVEWRALVPLTLAVLDPRFADEIAPFPTIAAQLLRRSTLRAQALVHQAAIAQVRHASTRVLLALWHLADRWGTVTRESVRVPVPLTHQLVAQITCLQRPTVSAAVRQLTQAGEISRSADGGWLLHGDPPVAERLRGTREPRRASPVG
jgi:hypothetical protein